MIDVQSSTRLEGRSPGTMRVGLRRLPMRLAALSRLGGPVALCGCVLAMAGCQAASSPQDATGVRALYRGIGIAASSGNVMEICDTDLDERLRHELEPLGKSCLSRTFERWSEAVRLSKIRTGTRIVVKGDEALVYAGAKPERAIYLDGRWLMDEAPELLPLERAAK
ncbi:MAG: hypothetical protein ACLQBB_12625 [Solirubrobacteraceae bacterium]